MLLLAKRRYFRDAWNYIDWACLVILAVSFLEFHPSNQDASQGTKTSNILSCTGLLLVFYRSFSFLRIFEAFTFLIGMINTIIQRLVIFFLILTYFFGVTSLLMMKLNPEASIGESLSQAYLVTFFGGIEKDDFGMYDLAGIPVIFGSVMVTIVLLNILIAFLSNLFSRLEDQQRTNNLKERGSMILDFEVIVYFFSYVLTRRVSKIKKLEKSFEKSFLDLGEQSTDTFDCSTQTNTLRKESRLGSSQNGRECFLYIFRKVHRDNEHDETIDENIYKKVKILSKKLEAMQLKLDNFVQEQRHFQVQSTRHFEDWVYFKQQISRHFQTDLRLRQDMQAQYDKVEGLLKYFRYNR